MLFYSAKEIQDELNKNKNTGYGADMITECDIYDLATKQVLSDIISGRNHMFDDMHSTIVELDPHWTLRVWADFEMIYISELDIIVSSDGNIIHPSFAKYLDAYENIVEEIGPDAYWDNVYMNVVPIEEWFRGKELNPYNP